MTAEIALVLLLLVCAMILFAWDILSIELVSLLLVTILAASGVIAPETAFQGFANETVIMLACVMVLSHRLTASGLIARITKAILRGRQMGQRRMTAWLMGVSALMSSIVTNTSTTAILIPAINDISKRTHVRPARFLMPAAIASMMGGSATLIGTSTNIAASGATERLGLDPFTMFEFTGVGLIVTAAGISAWAFFARFLLPNVENSEQVGSAAAALFMTTLKVPEGSKLINVTVGDVGFAAMSLTPRAINRANGRVSADVRRKLLAGDRIIVEGPRDAVLLALRNPQSGFEAAFATSDAGRTTQSVADAILVPGARWIGQTLNTARAQLTPDLSILALHRWGQKAPALAGRMRLKVGDILLVSGRRDAIQSVRDGADLSFLGTQQPAPPTPNEGKWTLIALLLAILAGTSGALPFSVAFLIAVLALILAGRFTLQDGFAMVSWRILILIGGMSSFGVAMLESGAATWLATGLLVLIGGYGPYAILLGLGVLTVLLTQPMSNAAAALTLLPVAIEMANQSGADPRPFMVMVTLSASLSFIAPFEPALLLVYGPGHYNFIDFVRAGAPLTVLSLALLLLLVPVFWPLQLALP